MGHIPIKWDCPVLGYNARPHIGDIIAAYHECDTFPVIMWIRNSEILNLIPDIVFFEEAIKSGP